MRKCWKNTRARYGLRALYRRSIRGEGWPGAALPAEADGQPLTHNLLSQLGVMNQDRNRDDIRTLQDGTGNQMVARNPNEYSNEGSSAILPDRELRHASFPFDHSIFTSVPSTRVGQPGQLQFLAQLSSSLTAPPSSDPLSLTYGMTMDSMDPQSLQNLYSYTTALGQQMTGPAPEWIMDIAEDDDEVLHLPESQLPRDA